MFYKRENNETTEKKLTIGATSKNVKKYNDNMDIKIWFDKFKINCRLNNIDKEALKVQLLLLGVLESVYKKLIGENYS